MISLEMTKCERGIFIAVNIIVVLFIKIILLVCKNKIVRVFAHRLKWISSK